MTHDPPQLLADIAAQCGSDVDMMTGEIELHGTLLLCLVVSSTGTVRPLALIGGRKLHRLAVLGHRAARDRNAFLRKKLGNLAVTQWIGGVLLGDEFANLGADGGRGSLGAIFAGHVTREKVAELVHATRCV